MNKHIIILNGKRYDAVTGKLIQAGETPDSTQHDKNRRPAHAAHRKLQAGRTPHQQAPAQSSESPSSAAPRTEHKRTRDHHGAPRHTHAHKPQAAKTLMRRAVHKPGTAKTPAVKQQYPVLKTQSGVTVEAPKRLVHNVDNSRLKRAQSVHKSTHVGRFQPAHLTPVKARIVPIAVSEPSTPVKEVSKPKLQTAAAPVQPHVKSKQKMESMLERAMQNATNHEQQPAKRSNKKRIVSFSAGIAAFVVLGGFVAFLNQSAISLQLASVRAGFQAGAPSYTPSGFKQEATAVQGKKVSIRYVSPADHRTYTLTQEQSNWDSQTLFDSIVANPDTKYQVIQSNGRNIYLYGNSQAAWVNGGVLYRIFGNTDLDGSDIVSIAASL